MRTWDGVSFMRQSTRLVTSVSSTSPGDWRRTGGSLVSSCNGDGTVCSAGCDVAGNQISDGGAEHIAHALEANTTIKVIDVSGR